MPEPVEVAIEAALLERATAFAQAQSLALSVPNVEFPGKNPDGSPKPMPPKWLRASLLPAPSFGLGVDDGSSNQHYGLLQLDVFWGTGAGELAPKRVAAAACTYFKRGTVLSKDGIRTDVSDVPRIGPSLLDASWWQIPVSIPYRCFASN